MHMLNKQRTTKREANRQNRSQAIVQAARHFFLEHGYAATSMSGLLKTLGGSKGTLWGYFHSKEKLFSAVIEDVASVFSGEVEAKLHDGTNIETTLTTFVEALITKLAQPEAIAAWRLIVGESGRFPELGRIFYEKAVMPILRSVAAYLTLQIAAGRLRDDDPMEMARTLVGFCTTRQNERLWGVRQDEADDIQEDASRYTGYFLRLFGVDPEAVNESF
ncbi:TetR/AcrR family transcriptional regulator [Sphingomonas bisphenolicum]